MSDYAIEPVRSSPWRVWLWALVATGAAGGAGYYAWQYRTLAEDKGAAGAKCSERLASLEQDHKVLTGLAQVCEATRKQLESQSQVTGVALAKIGDDLQVTTQEVAQLRAWKNESSRRMQTVKDMSQKLQKMVDAGKLGVQVRDGRLVVRLPEDVLFPSGLATLSRDGELALMEVAVVLKQFPDRRFMVAGHTDSEPVKSDLYKDNWDLSLARAAVVTRFMIEAKVKPGNLVAAGYGEFDPVASNKTPKGRRENRRIDIVLLPDLSELPALPGDMEATAEAAPASAPAR